MKFEDSGGINTANSDLLLEGSSPCLRKMVIQTIMGALKTGGVKGICITYIIIVQILTMLLIFKLWSWG